MNANSTIPSFPFSCPIRLRHLIREEFDQWSRQFMAHAFASQNELGRLCDEAVYQNDIALRLEASGFGPVAKEVPLTISFRDFTKVYYLDLVVRESFIVELKTVTTLLEEHDGQLLNYLFIAEAPHGKPVNLRPASVEYRTVNAVVVSRERRSFRLVIGRWQPHTGRCRDFLDLVKELFAAWGAFLDSRLYEEALIHLLGGKSNVLRRAPLTRAGSSLGTQEVAHLTDTIGFRVTGLAPDACAKYEAQHQRFLALTPLTTLHWLNLYHHHLELVTVKR